MAPGARKSELPREWASPRKRTRGKSPGKPRAISPDGKKLKAAVAEAKADKKITFGKTRVYNIEAENKRGNKAGKMTSQEADAVLKDLHVNDKKEEPEEKKKTKGKEKKEEKLRDSERKPKSKGSELKATPDEIKQNKKYWANFKEVLKKNKEAEAEKVRKKTEIAKQKMAEEQAALEKARKEAEASEEEVEQEEEEEEEEEDESEQEEASTAEEEEEAQEEDEEEEEEQEGDNVSWTAKRRIVQRRKRSRRERRDNRTRSKAARHARSMRVGMNHTSQGKKKLKKKLQKSEAVAKKKLKKKQKAPDSEESESEAVAKKKLKKKQKAPDSEESESFQAKKKLKKKQKAPDSEESESFQAKKKLKKKKQKAPESEEEIESKEEEKSKEAETRTKAGSKHVIGKLKKKQSQKELERQDEDLEKVPTKKRKRAEVEEKGEKKLADAEKQGILKNATKVKKINSTTHRRQYMKFSRWRKNKAFPSTLLAQMKTEEGRQKVFETYVKSGCSKAETVLKVQQELIESQKTSLKYGFRNDVWLHKHHGERKASKIMARKKALGLKLGFKSLG